MPKRANEIDIHVGKLIRIYRIKAGVTQSSLAKAAGVTFQQIQKYENGSNRVGAGRLATVAHALNVPASAFFEADESPGRLRRLSDDWAELLETSGSFRLLKAFAQICEPEVQRRFIALIEEIAASMQSSRPVSHQPRRPSAGRKVSRPIQGKKNDSG